MDSAEPPAIPTECAYCPRPVAFRCVRCDVPLCHAHAIACRDCGRHCCPEHAEYDPDDDVDPDDDGRRGRCDGCRAA